MRARHAEFLISASDARGFPRPDLPELAFSGRSNVGKSSLLNALVGVPGLARTSNTPGRTRLINWFRVEPPRGAPVAFVDLPGYGYAKVAKSERAAWQPLVEAYLERRQVIRSVLVLVDARRGGEAEEAELLEYLAGAAIPSQVILTKADKLAKARRKPAAAAVRRALGLPRDPLLASVQEPDSLADLWRYLMRQAL